MTSAPWAIVITAFMWPRWRIVRREQTARGPWLLLFPAGSLGARSSIPRSRKRVRPASALRAKRAKPEVCVLLVPVLLVLAGCMVGPDFRRPKTAVSPTWQEAADPRVSTAAATYRSWWTAFNDPALDRLIQHAYRENLSLRQAGVRVLQARAQLGVAVGEIFPQTQQAIGSVQYNRTSDRAVTGLATKSSVEYWQSQIGAQAS